jgi:hypothetical protein
MNAESSKKALAASFFSQRTVFMDPDFRRDDAENPSKSQEYN